MFYTREEKLKLKKKIYVTEKVYIILKKQKRIQKLSMAKLICNDIIEKYGQV